MRPEVYELDLHSRLLDSNRDCGDPLELLRTHDARYLVSVVPVGVSKALNTSEDYRSLG